VVAVPSLTFANAVGNQVLGGFQIDGNLTQATFGTSTPPPAGSLDWDSAAVQVNADGAAQPQPAVADPIGHTDTSVYSTGSKEGQNPQLWTINTSAGATPKGDMGNIYFWSHVDAATHHIFGYLGIERVSTSGTVDYYVELNQKKNVLSADHTVSVPNRSLNDIRLQVTDHGTSNWQVTATGNRWGPCPSPLPSGVTCVNGNTWIQDKALSADFYGLVNDRTIPDPAMFKSPIAAASKVPGSLVANQFTEFSIDLTAAGYVPDVCGTTVFGQLNVRSISSLSQSSESKDFAQGLIRTPNPCPQIVVTKQDESGKTITSSPATFKFAPDPTLASTAPGYATSSLTVTDGNAVGVCVPARTPCPGDADGVVNGVVRLNEPQTGATNITVTEVNAPSGYFIGTPASQTIAGPLEASTTYRLTFKDPLGALAWTKLDASTGQPVGVADSVFTVTATGGPAVGAPWSSPGHPLSITVTDDGMNDAAPHSPGHLAVTGLPQGTYTIKEISPPPGYLLPKPPANTITGIAVNSPETVDAGSFRDGFGAIAWRKLSSITRAPVTLAGAKFSLVATAGAALTRFHISETVVDNGAHDADARAGYVKVVDLPTGTYRITEIAPPPGYALPTVRTLTVVVTDTSFATVNAGAITDPPALPVIRAGHPTLPDTGGPSLLWLLFGGGLALAGAVLMGWGKARRAALRR